MQQNISSLVTSDTDAIATAVKRILKGNTTGIDAIFVPTQGDAVLMGELPTPPGVQTLFQSDLGIVRWNGVTDFLDRAKGTFLTRFEVKQGTPILYPILAERHDSHSGVPKLLVYFGIKLDDVVFEPKPEIPFQNIFWASTKDGKSWAEHLGKLRTPEKKRWHVQAIERALNFKASLAAA